jgi:predicted AlkP superfamily pyrophosphatase or phosphodiesterase
MKRTSRTAILCISTSLLLLAVPQVDAGDAETPMASRSSPPGPRLVLLLAVDQLRRDRLDPELAGGLGRLVRGGRVYREGVLDHAGTSTCPGHVSIATGRHPGPAGVPGNTHLNRETGASVYCVEDKSPDAAVLGQAPEKPGRSPRKIGVDALGDWMKRANPETRVFGVSPKDRAAIAFAGQHPDGAYWIARDGGFTTSRYYADELPEWVQQWNRGFFERLPAEWTFEYALEGERADDYPAESDKFGRSAPHKILDEQPEDTMQGLWRSPALDDLTLDFARELVEHERLGQGPATDLLALSLSATDVIGHTYGPESHESHDSLRRLDRKLGEFLDFLDERLGAGNTLVALSADHGVAALPEWLEDTGRSRCPVAGGRADIRWLIGRLMVELWWEFSPLFSIPGAWVHASGSGIIVSQEMANRHGVDPARVLAAAKLYLEEQPVIEKVWTPEEILSGTSPMAELFQHSFHPDRTGDLIVQIRRDCLMTPGDAGTTHGSPYLYDREVPIVFYGNGVEPGEISGTARTIDIAPTLARHLGIDVPEDLHGQALQ